MSEIASRLNAIKARLDAAAPGPWIWGSDWETLEYVSSEGGGDKYADLALRDAGGHEVVPIRIDHYEPIWDTRHPRDELTTGNRELIAHAPDDIRYLLLLLGAHP